MNFFVGRIIGGGKINVDEDTRAQIVQGCLRQV